ncbi:hypothetical protein COP2_000622 [Malus domestica]
MWRRWVGSAVQGSCLAMRVACSRERIRSDNGGGGGSGSASAMDSIGEVSIFAVISIFRNQSTCCVN